MVREAASIIVAIALAATIIGLVSIQFLGEDNAIEEAAEEVIKLETGVEVDLS